MLLCNSVFLILTEGYLVSNDVQLMARQQDFDLFYQDIESDKVTDFMHSFVRDNDVYFHITKLENLENILDKGFIPSQKLGCCYFGKSFYSCLAYFNYIPKPYVAFAVDLSSIFQEDQNTIKKGMEIIIQGSVDSKHIIGYLELS